MNMEQIKENLNESWNKSLMKIGFVLFGVSFGLEILVFVISYRSGIIESSVDKYFIKKILIPTGIIFFYMLIMFSIFKSKSSYLTNRRKEVFLCYSIFIVCVILAVANRYYQVLWVAPCACQYLHSVYANKKEVRQVYILTNIFVIICSVLAFIDGEYKVDYLAMTIACVIGMLYIIYSVAKLLEGFHSEQLEYLQESYKRQEELIKELQIDPMTGLYNKNALLDKISKNIMKKNKKKQTDYLVMLDLDHFKRINDTYGHVSGDEVICRLATLIKNNLNTDIEGFRFGGEEFIVLFQNSTIENVLLVTEAICINMRDSQFEFDLKLRITLSAGIAGLEYSMDGQSWIQKADEALYFAKNNGRNQIKVAK
ncbi:MAG: GGDEF domain-containing protein [Lachnospiraceae bacterium]|nr:GGDEF domain-containing protein [Lachnospiraceae bacterium]